MQNFDAINLESRQAVYQLLDLSKNELPKLLRGEVFTLSDLFIGYLWKRIPARDRKLLGRNFLDFALSEEGTKTIAVMDKTAQNQQLYAKK